MNLVFPLAGALDAVDLLTGSTDFTGAKLGLYSNDLSPTPGNVLADFTPCIYSGYAAKTVTWSPAFYDGNGVAVSSSGELLFAQSGATNDQCYGAFLTDSAGTKLLASGRLDDTPFSFNGNGVTLPLLLKLDVNGGLLSVSPVP